MKKILFNLITCNRFYYFKNCLESIVKCVDLDKVKLLVCDNNTIEPGFDEYLDRASLLYDIEVKKFKDRTKNELYRAMMWGVEFAKINEYQIIDFIQDDFQYLYEYDKHLDDVDRLFDKHPELVQVNVNMGWRRKAAKIGKIKVIESKGTKYGVLLNKVPCDNGFTRVSVYDKIGPYPDASISWGHGGKDRYRNKLNGEIWFGKQCKKRGLQRALTYMPNCGMMFDCAYVRGDERFGRYFSPPGHFYIKMLDDDRISDIRRKHNKVKYSFIEEFCEPDGWKPLTYGKHSPISKGINIHG